MLYRIEIEEMNGERMYERFVDAPVYRMVGKDRRLSLPNELLRLADQIGHEKSVTWGFVEVLVTIGNYKPQRVGYFRDNGSCVESILRETTMHVEKATSLIPA